MVISIWRYSHFMLAISSSVFILLASITGIILAIEPISEQLKPYGFGLESHTLQQTINTLKAEYNEVLTLEKDHNNYISASVITNSGESATFYINPTTGEKVGNLIERAPIYKFTTNFHRSLFLKSTGRIIVGIFSFFLFLIAISGIVLIGKRQGGWKYWFKKIVKENHHQYNHIIIGRITLIPIVIITVTGIFLSLEKFSILPSSTLAEEYVLPINTSNNSVLKTITLDKVEQVEFPFSDDPEDYFYIKLKDKELVVNQFSGQLISKTEYNNIHTASQWSMTLHTGRGSILWAFILLISTASILYFMYSGFAMTLQRRKKKALIPKNHNHKDEAEIIILVGSESNATYQPAKWLFDALEQQEIKVFISNLNSYTTYNKASQLIILTSTYGQGIAPNNAKKFLNKLHSITSTKPLDFAVVGFGSLAYPDFCKYAKDVQEQLDSNINFNCQLPLHTIHNQSIQSFKQWSQAWSNNTNITIDITPHISIPKKTLQTFKVIKRTSLNSDKTFLLQLKPLKKQKFRSGDLFAFYTENENTPRHYSIANYNDTILLSIKKHDLGVCSTLLSQLEKGIEIQGAIKPNQHFHLPKNKSVVLIGNGTGIAPYLGMLQEAKTTQTLTLFWGGKTKDSFNLYKDCLPNHTTIHTAFSREENKQYIQDVIAINSNVIINTLKNKGYIMLCGSLVMENDVKKTLNNLTLEYLNKPLDDFINQIKTDCY